MQGPIDEQSFLPLHCDAPAMAVRPYHSPGVDRPVGASAMQGDTPMRTGSPAPGGPSARAHRDSLQRADAAPGPCAPCSPLKTRRRAKWTKTLKKRAQAAIQELGGIEAATPAGMQRILADSGLTSLQIKCYLQRARLAMDEAQRGLMGSQEVTMSDEEDDAEGRGHFAASPAPAQSAASSGRKRKWGKVDDSLFLQESRSGTAMASQFNETQIQSPGFFPPESHQQHHFQNAQDWPRGLSPEAQGGLQTGLQPSEHSAPGAVWAGEPPEDEAQLLIGIQDLDALWDQAFNAQLEGFDFASMPGDGPPHHLQQVLVDKVSEQIEFVSRMQKMLEEQCQMQVMIESKHKRLVRMLAEHSGMDIPDDIPHAALPSLVHIAATGDQETFHRALRKVLDDPSRQKPNPFLERMDKVFATSAGGGPRLLSQEPRTPGAVLGPSLSGDKHVTSLGADDNPSGDRTAGIRRCTSAPRPIFPEPSAGQRPPLTPSRSISQLQAGGPLRPPRAPVEGKSPSPSARPLVSSCSQRSGDSTQSFQTSRNLLRMPSTRSDVGRVSLLRLPDSLLKGGQPSAHRLPPPQQQQCFQQQPGPSGHVAGAEEQPQGSQAWTPEHRDPQGAQAEVGSAYVPQPSNTGPALAPSPPKESFGVSAEATALPPQGVPLPPSSGSEYQMPADTSAKSAVAGNRRDTRASPQPDHLHLGPPCPSPTNGGLALEEAVEARSGGDAVAGAEASETLFKNIPTAVLQAEFIARLMRQGLGSAATEQQPAEPPQQQEPRGADKQPAVPLHEPPIAGAQQELQQNTIGASLGTQPVPSIKPAHANPQPCQPLQQEELGEAVRALAGPTPQAAPANHFEQARDPRSQGRLSLPSHAPQDELRPSMFHTESVPSSRQGAGSTGGPKRSLVDDFPDLATGWMSHLLGRSGSAAVPSPSIPSSGEAGPTGPMPQHPHKEDAGIQATVPGMAQMPLPLQLQPGSGAVQEWGSPTAWGFLEHSSLPTTGAEGSTAEFTAPSSSTGPLVSSHMDVARKEGGPTGQWHQASTSPMPFDALAGFPHHGTSANHYSEGPSRGAINPNQASHLARDSAIPRTSTGVNFGRDATVVETAFAERPSGAVRQSPRPSPGPQPQAPTLPPSQDPAEMRAATKPEQAAGRGMAAGEQGSSGSLCSSSTSGVEAAPGTQRIVNAIQIAVHELKGLASLGEAGSMQGAASQERPEESQRAMAPGNTAQGDKDGVSKKDIQSIVSTLELLTSQCQKLKGALIPREHPQEPGP